jgi:hypothetical protein
MPIQGDQPMPRNLSVSGPAAAGDAAGCPVPVAAGSAFSAETT